MAQEKTMTGYASIDKPWLKYYSEEAINAPLPECTVYENIRFNNSENMSDIALEFFKKKISYKTLFENVERVKHAFVSNGVKKGDRVIMVTSSTPELVYAVLALCRIGAIANMINPVFTLEQIKDRINETDAEMMLVLDQLYPKIHPIMSDLCVKKTVVIDVCNEMPKGMKLFATAKMRKTIPYGEGIIRWKDFLSEGKNAASVKDVPYEKDMPLVMVYSSGTTGASKGIVLTNDGINATISHYLSPDFPYNRGDKFLQIVPSWFSTGLILCLLMPICLGVTAILEPVFSKENFAKDIKKYRPNMILGATSLWNYTKDCKELKGVDLSFITYPITGGEEILSRTENAINEFLKNANCKSALLKGYGMCELGSTVSTDSSTIRKSGSAGFPIKGVTVAAFDLQTDKELKYGERGEIRVDSPAHMKEYFKNSKATEAYFYKDEKGVLWGCTGDIGYVDEEGFIYILGRATDTFVSKSGETTFCFDIESEIRRNAYVKQCEVVGLPVAGYEVPVAHIILEDNCSVSEQEVITVIHNSCVNKLSEDSVPCGYKIRKDFPVKSSGKRDMELIKSDREDFLIPTKQGIKKVTF